MGPSTARVKAQKRAIINRHARPDNLNGLNQAFTTLIPLAVLWYAAVRSADISYWLTAGITALMALMLLRVFMMMHECGHGTLCRTRWLTKTFGYVFGVISGLPTYVWGEHHAYHHATNGNWEKYRGPLSIRSVTEYEAMTDKQRRAYRRARNIWLAPFGGFSYLIFNPRFTWLKGSINLAGHLVSGKIARPTRSVKAIAAEFKTPYWTSAAQYWHMFWNNLGLIGVWILMSWAMEPLLFFCVYLVSTSLSGGAAIVLFTVQHNFEHSYATDTKVWDYDTAALHGTSFLVLPRWLNWLTANIAYHHVHHLSSAIPNYRLIQCHNENQELFTGVTRITLSQVHRSLKFILWDTRQKRIISIAEYEAGNLTKSVAAHTAA